MSALCGVSQGSWQESWSLESLKGHVLRGDTEVDADADTEADANTSAEADTDAEACGDAGCQLKQLGLLGQLYLWGTSFHGMSSMVALGWPDFLRGSSGLPASPLTPVSLDVLIFLQYT